MSWFKEPKDLKDITLRAIEMLQNVDLIAAEDTRHTGLLLKHYDIKTPLTSYFEHNKMRKADYTRVHFRSRKTLVGEGKACSGCQTCLVICSLVHEGKENLSLSRIQILSDSFGGFPTDITIAQCRQCEDPACVKACDTGALHAAGANGNIRIVDEKKCIGCMRCIHVCPFMPGRIQWNSEKECAQKCDLCADTPFWEQRGGLGGKQACVELCPMRAIKFTDQVPVQKGDSGYNVNLRNENWKKLGFPIT